MRAITSKLVALGFGAMTAGRSLQAKSLDIGAPIGQPLATMQTVIKSHEFSSEFPERFEWERIDSPKLAEIAVELARRVVGESLLIPSQRIRTPGLRVALNAIAEIAQID